MEVLHCCRIYVWWRFSFGGIILPLYGNVSRTLPDRYRCFFTFDFHRGLCRLLQSCIRLPPRFLYVSFHIVHLAFRVFCLRWRPFETFGILLYFCDLNLNLLRHCSLLFFCYRSGAVDLPEFKGKHRKFRNLVSSYLGKLPFSTHIKPISLACFILHRRTLSPHGKSMGVLFGWIFHRQFCTGMNKAWI